MNTSLPSTSAPDHSAGDHALVIGGSMAGLLAARVLSDRFARVTVVDWDHFPREADHRRRVPQSRHAHGLLERGQAIIARLFPGIGDELAADGALVADGEAITIVTPAGRLPSFPPADGSAAKGFFASRVLLEWHVRRHMAARDGVRLVEGSRVRGLVAGEDGRGVGGARVESEGGAEEVVAADLVVDASGRQSKAPDWLEELGYERPEEEVIESGIGYASRFYERPEGWPADWEGIIMNGRPPHNPRAGLILPVENGGWHVTLGGFAGHHPPTDEEGFHAWARALPDPSIAEAIRVARPLTPIRSFRTPTNRLRRFDRLRRSPERFVAIGDSVCAFNPIYGQGMTVSAMDAELLEAELARGRGSADPAFAQRFQRRLAKLVSAPWLVASAEDLRWKVPASGARPAWITGAIHRYMDLVLRAARREPHVAGAYMGVVNLNTTPRALFSPRVVRAVARAALREGRDPADDPALSPAAVARLRTMPSRVEEKVLAG